MAPVYVRRKQYFSQLEKALLSKKALVYGLRRSGKTSFVLDYFKDQKDRCIHLPLSYMDKTPELFSLELIAAVISKTVRHTSRDMDLLLAFREEIGQEAYSFLKVIENELEKIKPNQELILSSAFSCVSTIYRRMKQKFVLFFDDVEYLPELNNFSQVKDVFSLLPADVGCVFSATSLGGVKEGLECDTIQLEGFDTKEIEELLLLLRIKADAAEILRYTKGSPHAVMSVLSCWQKSKSVEEQFYSLLLNRNSALFCSFKETFDFYLNRARGQALIHSILKVICSQDLRLSEIARKVYRSAPVTKALLERLLAVGVIEKKGKLFFVADPVLKVWIRCVSSGLAFDDELDLERIQEALG